MSDKADKVFIRNFSLIIAALFVVMVVLIVVAGRFHDKLTPGDNPIAAAAVEERIVPTTTVRTGDSPEQSTPEPDVDTPSLSGVDVYNQLCTSCHTAGVAGAPTLDSDDWKTRIANGVDGLYSNAINGFQGSAGYMPAKGGNPTYSDDEVRAAVDYMVDQAGG